MNFKVLCDAPGQTCNRLWSYVASISECIVKNKSMVIIYFDYTIDDFPNLRYCSFIYFPLYFKWFLNTKNGWNKFKGLTWKATHNEYLDKIYFSLGFIKGWHTRNDIKYIPEAKEELIKIFTPKKTIVNEAEKMFSIMRENADIIVGIHVRRGDYATWNNGKYFYSLTQYHDFMKRVKKLYNDKKVVFFISSNEKFSLSLFDDCTCYRHENSSSVILDLYSLSLCDRIIGPISTFSRWASFYGEKPLCFLTNANQEFSEDSFSKIVDYFHFENGITIPDI